MRELGKGDGTLQPVNLGASPMEAGFKDAGRRLFRSESRNVSQWSLSNHGSAKTEEPAKPQRAVSLYRNHSQWSIHGHCPQAAVASREHTVRRSLTPQPGSPARGTFVRSAAPARSVSATRMRPSPAEATAPPCVSPPSVARDASPQRPALPLGSSREKLRVFEPPPRGRCASFRSDNSLSTRAPSPMPLGTRAPSPMRRGASPAVSERGGTRAVGGHAAGAASPIAGFAATGVSGDRGERRHTGAAPEAGVMASQYGCLPAAPEAGRPLCPCPLPLQPGNWERTRLGQSRSEAALLVATDAPQPRRVLKAPTPSFVPERRKSTWTGPPPPPRASNRTLQRGSKALPTGPMYLEEVSNRAYGQAYTDGSATPAGVASPAPRHRSVSAQRTFGRGTEVASPAPLHRSVSDQRNFGRGTEALPAGKMWVEGSTHDDYGSMYRFNGPRTPTVTTGPSR
ncbi:unnamed protein product [Polarella glacialis]|uniref:Uncharacterized protein n=1 Tax=Polarella glacialis TaxID=89957 RepID=A0A813K4J1_POLGL|nr:unnamed protein product [Polarella glacialis]